MTAADRIIADGIADVVFIGDKADILAKAAELGLNNIDKATVINPNDAEAIEKYAQLFYELRKAKGVTIEDARKKVLDPLYLGCLLIKAGDADGQVAGAMNTTGNVLRAAFQVLKTAPGISTVSGAFLMLLPEGSPYGHETPSLYCINIDDGKFEVEKQYRFKFGDWPSEVQLNGTKDKLYWLNDDVWMLDLTKESAQPEVFLPYDGTLYYGLTIDPVSGDVYIADAIDYVKQGMVYRYSKDKEPLDSFYVGIIPGAFCWK
jgi:hypothetical protein